MTASVDNYFIGKGIVSFTPNGGSKRDLGNAPTLELTPNIEKLDHFSSRSGVRVKDRSIVLEKSMTVRLVLEEWTQENLLLALLGDVDSGGDIDIFATNAIDGTLELVGTNEIGKQFTLTCKVSFIPSGTLGFITDEWGQIELTGEVLLDNGSFGKLADTTPSA
jgi:hypothetical protein